MPRINRRRLAMKRQGLSDAEHMELVYGMAFSGQVGFPDRVSMEKAWWENRDRLLAESDIFRRPAAFWAFEHKRYPNSGDELDLMLSLSVPLTARERHALTTAVPIWIPDEVPSIPLSIETWKERLRSIEVRRLWHLSEGRTDMAAEWAAQGEILLERIGNAMQKGAKC